MKIMTYNVQTGRPSPTRAANVLNNILDFDADIVGIVDFKIPYIGYPTLWLRSLFSR